MTSASDSLSIASTKEKQDLMERAYSLVHYEWAAASGIVSALRFLVVEVFNNMFICRTKRLTLQVAYNHRSRIHTSCIYLRWRSCCINSHYLRLAPSVIGNM